MRFASLGSGSRGNAWLVEAGQTRVLVDAGFGPRETVKRLGRLGVEGDSIDAVILTHEHGDHVAGAMRFAARHTCPVWLSRGSLAAMEAKRDTAAGVRVIDGDFAVGDLQIQPYPVPHDAREPLQFVLSDGDRRLGMLTDAGHVTEAMEASLAGCHALVLECNHDLAMLAEGRYSAPLKARIRGHHGHLDNTAAAALLTRIANGKLRHVVAAHLSAQNNRPELARAALADALGCDSGWIGVADQATGLEWRAMQ